MSIKTDLLNMITSKGGGVTFVELCDGVEGFSGDLDVGMMDKNIVFWSGVSEESIDAIWQLSEEQKIKCTPTDVLCYLVDGGALTLPLVKKARAYKKPHWLPIVFNLPSQDGVFFGVAKKHK